MQEERQFIFEEELTDFIYRSVFTSIIAEFMFLEIYNAVDAELITRGTVFAVILISISVNAFLLLYHRVKFYLIPAFVLVALVMYLAIDREDVHLILESAVFSVFLIVLASFVLFLISDRVPVTGMIVAVGVLVYMICELTFGYDMYPASPALGIIYAVTVLIRFLRNGLKKAPDRADIERTRRYITFLLPFILAMLLFLLILPKPDKPVSWKWVSNLYEYTSEKINTLFHRISDRFGEPSSETFRISFEMHEKMTYDNSHDDGTELFEITPDGTVFGSLYLKGAIYNRFENGQWLNTLTGEKDYSRIDAFETRLGVENYSQASVNSLLRENNLKIKILEINSPIVFAPSKMTRFSDISVKKHTGSADEILMFDRNAPYGSEYSLSFLQMNIGNTVFNDYMNSAPAHDDADLFNIVKRNFQSKYVDLTYEDLVRYRGYVEENYTSSPEIRDSVKRWIEAVWEQDAMNRENTINEEKYILSDYERLVALEQALSGFKYELDTPNLPSYVKDIGDFINYFILEKREGYCVHYATAFCLLAHYLGYPARIVQGYKTDAVMNETTKVIEGSGHCWPEVYFEGKGWVPFEPTPGMGAERYAGWAVRSGKIKETDSFHREKEEEAPILPDDIEYEREHRESFASGVLLTAIAGIVVLSILLLVVARILIRRRRLKRMNGVEQYLLEFEMIRQVLAHFGIKRDPSETLTEFGLRAESEMKRSVAADNTDISQDLQENNISGSDDIFLFMKSVASFENYRYGGKIPDDNDIHVLRQCREQLEAMMKDHFGKKYWLHRLKMMIERNVI